MKTAFYKHEKELHRQIDTMINTLKSSVEEIICKLLAALAK